jgi:hypothetical protein
MASHTRAVAVTLLVAAAFYTLLDVVAAAQFGKFENPHPTLFARLGALWSIPLLVVPGTLVAFLGRERVPHLSAIAYPAGFLAHYLYHFGEWDQPPRPMTDLHSSLSDLCALLVLSAVGAIVGFAAAHIKRRLTHVGADRDG